MLDAGDVVGRGAVQVAAGKILGIQRLELPAAQQLRGELAGFRLRPFAPVDRARLGESAHRVHPVGDRPAELWQRGQHVRRGSTRNPDTVATRGAIFVHRRAVYQFAGNSAGYGSRHARRQGAKITARAVAAGPEPMLDLEDIFGRDSPLERALPDFKVRRGQLAMAQRVASALAARESLIVEAGTGTGKTFAYLVPALLSGPPVLISTGTPTLQDHLFGKYLPLVAAALGRPAP